MHVFCSLFFTPSRRNALNIMNCAIGLLRLLLPDAEFIIIIMGNMLELLPLLFEASTRGSKLELDEPPACDINIKGRIEDDDEDES